MATIQNFLQGQHIVTLTIQPMLAAATGLLGNVGAAENLILSVDQISISGRTRTTQIVPLTSTRDNEVPIEVSAMMTVTEILKRTENAASPNYNQLKRIWNQVMAQTVRQALLVFSRGGSGTGGQYAFYALISGYQETGRKEKNTGRMTFEYQDTVDVANPVYAAA